MISFRRPSTHDTQFFLKKQAEASFSYTEIGASNEPVQVSNYNDDNNRVLLGQGQAVYEAACKALRQWRMFPSDWAWIEPHGAPIRQGETLVMVARIFGLHWFNACRIVYVLDGAGPERRFGFAYGTLPNHVECGEERFSVEWRDDDTVWYDLKAFSRPKYWLVRLFKPVARQLQRRFVRESLRAMQVEIEKLDK